MVRTRTSTLGAASKFATGTYIGNGAATQAIVLVGFQPKGIIIYEQQNVNQGTPQYKITQDGLNALWFNSFAGGALLYEADMIISLDADGFTVGDGTPFGVNCANQLGVTYTYIAFG